MIHVNVESAIKKLKKDFPDLSKKQTETAIKYAFNEATRKSRVYLSKEVRKDYTIRARDFNKGISVRKLYKSSKTLYTHIKISGKKHSIDRFSTKQTKKGLNVSIHKGKRKKIYSAFLADVSGRKRAFARGQYSSKGFSFRKKRVNKRGNDLPIVNLSGMSNANMVLAKDNKLLNMTGRKLENEAVSSLKSFFTKAGRGYI
jgi:hypothetical protein